MTSTKDIYWLAGLFEGEGSFNARSSQRSKRAHPILQIGMTDRDIIERAAVLLRHTGGIGIEGLGTTARRTKPLFRIVISGPRAIGWMMTLYPLLGERRRLRIHEIIDGWKAAPARGRWKRRQGYKYGDGLSRAA